MSSNYQSLYFYQPLHNDLLTPPTTALLSNSSSTCSSKHENYFYPMDSAFLTDRKWKKKKTEKIVKYIDLGRELKKLKTVKMLAIVILVGHRGTVSK